MCTQKLMRYEIEASGKQTTNNNLYFNKGKINLYLNEKIVIAILVSRYLVPHLI